MYPSQHRAKGPRALGAKGPGQSGPFGPYLDDAFDEPPDDGCVSGGDERGPHDLPTLGGGEGYALVRTPGADQAFCQHRQEGSGLVRTPGGEQGHAPTVTPDDRIAAQIAEASRRREASRARRQALNAARQRGLAARHAAKLRALAERDRQTQPEPPDAA